VEGVIVIGIGHPDRGDDAAGLLVARRLATSGSIPLDVRESTGDLAALVDAWSGVDGVVLVDATVGGGAPGDIRVVDLLASPAPAGPSGGSSHGFGLAEAIALSRALGTLPKALRLVGIEGATFDIGARPSPAVMAAIPAAAAAARAESLRLVAALAQQG
jgi:hydrogenase maturation protease